MRQLIVMAVFAIAATACGGTPAASVAPESQPVPSTAPVATAEPTPLPTEASTASPVSEFGPEVAHITAAIDELVPLIEARDGDAAAEWINAEGVWVTDNLETLITSPVLMTYADAVVAALGKVAAGADFLAEVEAIVELRETIAQLAP